MTVLSTRGHFHDNLTQARGNAMMVLIRLAFLTLIVSLSFQLSAQTILYTQSFEAPEGADWSMVGTFDNTDQAYFKRDSATATAFPGLLFPIAGANGDFVIGAENTDDPLSGVPGDGELTLNLGSYNVSGEGALDLIIALACNAEEEGFDDRSFLNGDYLDLQTRSDGGAWTTIASFNSEAGGTSISTLYHDIDMDGDGGELGELPLTTTLMDFVVPITNTASELELRLLVKIDGGDEEVVIDNFILNSF